MNMFDILMHAAAKAAIWFASYCLLIAIGMGVYWFFFERGSANATPQQSE